MQREMFKKPGAPAQQSHPAPAVPSTTTVGDNDAWRSYYDSRRDVKVGKKSFNVYTAGKGPVVFFMLHGAGHSALSYAVLAARLKQTAAVVAYDARGHGGTSTEDDADLSADTLVGDATDVARAVLAEYPESPVVLVGHSMGGAIAIKAAQTGRVPRLSALVVIDVVEGTALAALHAMAGILEARPAAFPDVSSAVSWSYGYGGTRNPESATVAVPAQLRREAEGRWVWRTDLLPTQKYWRGWFENISAQFLSAPVPKLLVVAGTDRLDTALTIAQMQGKFMIKLMPTCGHLIHEDEPVEVASALLSFAQRFARVLKLPPKMK